MANLPENASLSLTLDGLCSYAEVFLNPQGSGSAQWIAELPSLVPQDDKRAAVPSLSKEGSARALAHLASCLRLGPAILGRHGIAARAPASGTAIELRTANTFPHGSGIASSASSFAAVTLAAVSLSAEDPEAFSEALASDRALRESLSRLSRAGSGSSCRSFDGPWVLWESEEGQAIPNGMPALANFVIVISDTPKKIPSSRAHELVKSSPLWTSRPERARQRLDQVRAATESGDLRELSLAAWAEAWEMHSLFHTSAEPFSYWEPGTLDALQFLARFLKDDHPPIITLDAGPNIHVLVEQSRAERWRATLCDRFGAERLLEDRQGTGATWVGGV